ncbi:hypothetical protein Pan189_03640 [Stratiformator vulcanicus]|uniref:Uncharacterized protein n=1 Tax=Stratiformator vulcanicus TaxID=2527980 RepID=A0A517QWG9_9PLAN|nr:hypothetical protein Pan189_03640 [Stratiformator vulcanicus]
MSKLCERTLYFDIDGVKLWKDDEVKPALTGEILHRELDRKRFTRLECVSGHSGQLFLNSLQRPGKFDLDIVKTKLADLLEPAFPDRDGFIKRLVP